MSLHSVLLGLPAVEELGVVKFMNEVGSSEAFESPYPQLFPGIGTFTGEYTIRLKPDPVPHSDHVARRVPIPMRDTVKPQHENMERQGVIQRVEGSTEWCAGIVPVLKPPGGVHICVNLTQPNLCVLREHYVCTAHR